MAGIGWWAVVLVGGVAEKQSECDGLARENPMSISDLPSDVLFGNQTHALIVVGRPFRNDCRVA